jgi:hypothetical protein
MIQMLVAISVSVLQLEVQLAPAEPDLICLVSPTGMPMTVTVFALQPRARQQPSK